MADQLDLKIILSEEDETAPSPRETLGQAPPPVEVPAPRTEPEEPGTQPRAEGGRQTPRQEAERLTQEPPASPRREAERGQERPGPSLRDEAAHAREETRPLPVHIVLPLPVPVVLPPGQGGGGKEASGTSGIKEMISGIPVVGKALSGAITLVNGAFNAARAAAHDLGNSLKALAAGDVYGTLRHAAQGAADALGAIPLIGGPLKAIVGGLASIGDTLKGMIDGLTARGRQLAGYSPEIAMAQARSEIQTMLNDFREAQELGANYANMIDRQTELQEELNRMMLPVKELLLDEATVVLQWVRENMPLVKGFVETIAVSTIAGLELLRYLYELLKVMAENMPFLKAVFKSVDEILKNVRQTREHHDEVADPINVQIKAILGVLVPAGAAIPDPIRAAAMQQAAAPAFALP